MTGKVIIHSDGSCLGNPGPGGWGAVLEYTETGKKSIARKIISGHANHETTNNQMELTSCIKPLASLKRSCTVEIYTDSKYVTQGMNTWIHNWRKNGWKNSKNKPVKNQDLWIALYDLSKQIHFVTYFWIPGHAGIQQNELADAHAVKEAYKASFRLKNGYEQL